MADTLSHRRHPVTAGTPSPSAPRRWEGGGASGRVGAGGARQLVGRDSRPVGGEAKRWGGREGGGGALAVSARQQVGGASRAPSPAGAASRQGCGPERPLTETHRAWGLWVGPAQRHHHRQRRGGGVTVTVGGRGGAKGEGSKGWRRGRRARGRGEGGWVGGGAPAGPCGRSSRYPRLDRRPVGRVHLWGECGRVCRTGGGGGVTTDLCAPKGGVCNMWHLAPPQPRPREHIPMNGDKNQRKREEGPRRVELRSELSAPPRRWEVEHVTWGRCIFCTLPISGCACVSQPAVGMWHGEHQCSRLFSSGAVCDTRGA